MVSYYVKRIGQAVVSLFSVITLSFFLYRLMPGSAVTAIRMKLMSQMDGGVGQGSGGGDSERINALIEVYTGINPSKPAHIAYFEYIRDIVLYQDFGQSIWFNEPVFQLLFKAMPWSIFISSYGLVLSFAMTVLFGSLMAYKEGSRFDSGMTMLIIGLHSIPYYVGAIIMLILFAYNTGWFPTGGRVRAGTTPGFNYPFVAGLLEHATLPIATAFIIGFGGAALNMRGNSIRVLGADYLRVGQLRGLSTARLTSRYVARNAILPMYTSYMIRIATIFGGSVILEALFSYPGVGWYTFKALVARDYPVLMAALIFFSTITLTAILVADFTYGMLDPRAGIDTDYQ